MSIFTYQNLYKSYLECRQSKRKTVSALEFELNLEENLFNLLNDLRSGEYAPGRSICFAVTEPKPREIFAAGFRDRIVHHLFANLYLNELDYFVKQRLRQKYYLRYVDDFIILGKGRAELSEIPCKIDVFLGGCLALGINFKKTKLKSLKQGVDFLGYIIKLDYTLVRQRSVNVCKNKIYKQLAGFNKNNGKILGKKFIAQVNSYLGHFRHADSFFLRKHLIIDHLRVAGRFIYNRNYKSININF